MKLKIGDAIAFREPEEWTVVPDDRQEKHQTIDGVIVEDYGHVEAGDVITCTVVFSYENYGKLYTYWLNRTKVTVVDTAGREWKEMRVVIKEDTYLRRHHSFHKVKMELWRG